MTRKMAEKVGFWTTSPRAVSTLARSRVEPGCASASVSFSFQVSGFSLESDGDDGTVSLSGKGASVRAPPTLTVVVEW